MMPTDIHHRFKPESTHASHYRLFVAAALTALLIILGGASLTYRTAAQGTLMPVTSVARPLDELGFGSARALLIAGMRPEAQAVNPIIAACSPFGSLTACASHDFVGLTQISVSAPI